MAFNANQNTALEGWFANSDFNFKVKPSDYLGTAHEAFKSDMMQLALASPSEYFQLRKVALKNIKEAAVNTQYSIYYHLLSMGRQSNGTTDVLGTPGDSGLQQATINKFRPQVPKQQVNEFALKAAKTIDAIAEEAIEMLLPMNYKKISEDRQVQQTAGTLGFGPP